MGKSGKHTKNKPSLMNAHVMIEARHSSNARDMDKTAEPLYPLTKKSELMQSPCRPEENGYFGATYGIPSKVYYEFEMEARHGAKFDEALMIVEEHMIDMVLSVTFPSICSFDGDGRPPAQKPEEVVITGFKFGEEKLNLNGACTPVVGKKNTCTKISGEIYIFGNDVIRTVYYAQSVINFAVSGVLPRVLTLGIQRIDVVGIEATDPSLENMNSGIFPLPLSVLSGLVASGVCIILGIILLIIYMRKDRVRHHKLVEQQRTLIESMSGTLSYFGPDSRKVSDSENASLTSDISSVHNDFGNGRVYKIPNDKVRVQFDPDYASECGLSEAGSQRSCRTAYRQPSETMSHPPHYLDKDGRYNRNY